MACHLQIDPDPDLKVFFVMHKLPSENRATVFLMVFWMLIQLKDCWNSIFSVTGSVLFSFNFFLLLFTCITIYSLLLVADIVSSSSLFHLYRKTSTYFLAYCTVRPAVLTKMALLLPSNRNFLFGGPALRNSQWSAWRPFPGPSRWRPCLPTWFSIFSVMG